MPADTPLGIAPADLQTLINTLQQLVVTGGSIVQAIVDPAAVPRQSLASRLTGGHRSATLALVPQPATPPLEAAPAAPEGYWVVDIPGVGERRVPYYPASS